MVVESSLVQRLYRFGGRAGVSSWHVRAFPECDGWFNLCTLVPECRTGVKPHPAPESIQPDSGHVRLLKSTINYKLSTYYTSTPYTHHRTTWTVVLSIIEMFLTEGFLMKELCEQ